MNRTKIEWVKNLDGSPGYTWNPVWGCKNHCQYCYARIIARRFGKQVAEKEIKYREANGIAKSENPILHNFIVHLRNWADCDVILYPCNVERVQRFEPTVLFSHIFSRLPSSKKPSAIFINSMSDPAYWDDNTVQMVLIRVQSYAMLGHKFILLTKSVDFLLKYGSQLGSIENLWVGLTVGNHTGKHNPLAILPYFTDRFIVNHEPILSYYSLPDPCDMQQPVSWIILGAQTDPMPQFVERCYYDELLRQARERKIPVFIKDSLDISVPGIIDFSENRAIPYWVRDKYGKAIIAELKAMQLMNEMRRNK